VYGSVVLASFNIRKLGNVKNRTEKTWSFLAHVCSHFDILAVQEVLDDLSGVRRLVAEIGPDFGVIGSDITGAFPGEPGLSERLGFMFRRSMIKRAPIVSDITYDRSKVLETLAGHKDQIEEAITPYSDYLQAVKEWEAGGEAGPKPQKPKVKLPVFLSFIRQPFCVGFEIVGHPGTQPYQIMAVNAHLYYGDFLSDRRQEFDALMEWIMARVKQKDRAYYPNFVLLGDLNLDFDNPRTDRARIEKHIKTFNDEMSEGANVNFPFLDVHPGQDEVFRTNARMSQTFDHIGLFSRDPRLPTFRDNEKMGQNPPGPDYGMFNFVELFSQALHDQPFGKLSSDEQQALFKRFEHNVSDHMPIWLRLPLP
jgi:endonuclease/exonuclease/phosphatase family metal-dependent hydrolase